MNTDLVVGQSLRDKGDGLAFAVGQQCQHRVGARLERLGDVPIDHLDVDQRDIRQVLLGQGQALAAVAGLGYNFDVVLDVEQSAESAADEWLIVDQQYADHDG